MSYPVNGIEDDCICIIAPICQKILCLESRNQTRCNCAIRFGTRSDKESHRHTMRIHGQMDLGVRPCLKNGGMRDWCRFFCQARRSDAGILTDFKSRQRSPGGKRCLQDPFPDPLVTPSAEPAVYILPVSLRFRPIPPGRSGAQNPEYSVDKLPGITDIPSLRPLFTNGIRPDFLPRSVADIVSMLFHRHCLPSAILRTIIPHAY